MSKLTWNIVHECDDEEGNPVQWVTKINHPKYGKYSNKEIRSMENIVGLMIWVITLV